MSTLKVDAIRHNSATSDAITTASDGTCTAKVTNSLSNRRLNFNGAMLVNQRGNKTGAVQSGYYCTDRYYTQMNDNSNGTWSVTQAADVPDGYGFKYSMEYSCTATTSNANRYLMTVYRMEGNDSMVFNYGTANAKTVTLSFWIKCSKAGNFQVNFENEDGVDAGYQTQQTINTAGQWEKKVVTIPGDTSKALIFGTQKAFCFDIMYSAFGTYASQTPTAAWSTLANEQRGGHCNMDLFDSTSNYVKITGVQLELGDHASDFEHRSFGEELQRCSRYYQKIAEGNSKAIDIAYSYNAQYADFVLQYPMGAMRGIPSLDQVTGADYYNYYTGTQGPNLDGVFILEHATLTQANIYFDPDQGLTPAQSGYLKTNNSAAYLAISAEL